MKRETRKKLFKWTAFGLIAIAYFSFPDLGWRHILLIATQLCIAAA